jgi:hypothetical protein
MEENMTTINGNQKELEKDNWLSLYLPAICAATIMAAVLFVAVSCSKKDNQPVAKMTAPAAPEMNTPAPSAAPTAAPEPPKKVKKHHRPANATYVNGTYGVSFSYPVKYTIDDDKPMALNSKFLAGDAVEVATVKMPSVAYPDTDFSGALLNVSVSSKMTEEQCDQFLSLPDAKAEKPTSLKLGANSFAEVEDTGSEPYGQSDVKYFHLFKNGACYEFALEVETMRNADEDLAQVDRGKVFAQLEKILTTARIKDAEVPGVENAQKPATTETTSSADPKSATGANATPDSKATPDPKAEKAQVVAPTEAK